MAHHKFLGTITPSSNTVVEQVTQAIVGPLDGISAHFSRIPLFGDGRKQPSPNTYDYESMLSAAELLSHAKMDVICWNGSKGGALGFDIDTDLCRRITERTGVQAVTSALATLEVLRLFDVERFALITPYRDFEQQPIINSFNGKGFNCVAERHGDLADNFAFSTMAPETLGDMAREAVGESGAQAVVFFCTNLLAAPITADLEQELGLPVVDSVAVGVWRSMKAVGFESALVRGWGSLFGR